MTDHFEALVIEQMRDVSMGATKEIIDANYVGSFGEQPIAKM
jgi:hypothetical protein